MSSFKPSERADQVEAGEEVPGGLLVTGGDAAKMLDGIEEPLDEIAFAVEREVAGTFDFAVRFRRDDRLDGAPFEAGDEAVGVITFVAEKGSGLDLGSQCFGLRDIVDLASGETEHERISQGVDDGMDFRRQAAARAAYGLVLAPFLRAPALC